MAEEEAVSPSQESYLASLAYEIFTSPLNIFLLGVCAVLIYKILRPSDGSGAGEENTALVLSPSQLIILFLLIFSDNTAWALTYSYCHYFSPLSSIVPVFPFRFGQWRVFGGPRIVLCQSPRFCKHYIILRCFSRVFASMVFPVLCWAVCVFCVFPFIHLFCCCYYSCLSLRLPSSFPHYH
ncbi:hypothetical protein E2C01_061415 [Portunus trituberculatus]|uniref:Uncharacterized protein n=1 Tax=Portunus trituberculatus TaxID=210409 RepID=A0A5B7HEZ5_PORTR|nr:hypothetical protein [Portunus trituberculatus]